MKLMHPALAEPIAFCENRIAVLTVERPELYRSMALDLIRQSEGEEGEWILSEEGKILDCAASLHAVYDFAHLEDFDKRASARFFSGMQKIAFEDLQQETHGLMRNIQEYLGRLAVLSDHPVTYDAEENIPALIKAFGFRIDLSDLPPSEMLYEHMRLYEKALKQACFVLIGAKAWFAKDELIEIYKMASYRKWKLLLLERYPGAELLPEEDLIVIDRDLCELRREGG